METVLTKIRDKRKEKGFSLENMADELHISPSAYRKIEDNQSKLSVERMIQIATILEMPPSELLGDQNPRIYQQTNRDNGTVIGHQEFENYYQENKEITQSLVASLKDEISHIKSEIEFLRGIVKKQ
jgi:transcriptional regulator with XRE-family HTH domain